MAEFIEEKEQAVNKGDPLIFENKTGYAFDVSVGIVFHKSGIYEVTIAENRTVVSKVMERPPEQSDVINCKDCDWWTKQEDSVQGRCELMQMYPTGEWFCANAKRRQDG